MAAVPPLPLATGFGGALTARAVAAEEYCRAPTPPPEARRRADLRALAVGNCCLKGSLTWRSQSQLVVAQAGVAWVTTILDPRRGAEGREPGHRGRRLVGAGVAEHDRHGDDRHREQRDQRQQVALAQVVVEVDEEAGRLDLGQLDLRSAEPAHRALRAGGRGRGRRRRRGRGDEVAGAGAVGVAPAAPPWPWRDQVRGDGEVRVELGEAAVGGAVQSEAVERHQPPVALTFEWPVWTSESTPWMKSATLKKLPLKVRL